MMNSSGPCCPVGPLCRLALDSSAPSLLTTEEKIWLEWMFFKLSFALNDDSSLLWLLNIIRFDSPRYEMSDWLPLTFVSLIFIGLATLPRVNSFDSLICSDSSCELTLLLFWASTSMELVLACWCFSCPWPLAVSFRVETDF